MKFIKIQIYFSIIYELFNSLLGLQVALSNYDISYCSSRMNYTHRFGCSSTQSDGIIKIIRTFLNIESIIKTETEDKIILVIPTSLFTNPTVMKMILNYQMISGIIVLAPSKGKAYNVHYFRENQRCDNNHQTCNKTKFDLFSNGYYYTQFEIPVVLLSSRNPEFQRNIIDCYEKYNFMNDKGSKCKITISNHNPHVLNVKQCLYERNTLKNRFQLNMENAFCKVINGLNIYVTFNKVKFYGKKSIILICAKMDAISMFDTAAIGAEELYPRAALMIHMATIFKQSVETELKNQEILMAFIDNDSYGKLGSIKLIYDLKSYKVSNGMLNISDNNIALIVMIGEISNASTLVVVDAACMTSPICKNFKRNLLNESIIHDLKLRTSGKGKSENKIWVDLLIPFIEIRSELITSNLFKNSYLDFQIFNDYKILTNISKTISASILKTFNNSQLKSFYDDLKPEPFEPFELINCFVNISCDLLKNIIGQKEMQFYEYFANPFKAQSFVDGFISTKHGRYYNRLSEFILKLLIIYLGHEKPNYHNCNDVAGIIFFSTEILDKLTCFETTIQISRDFNPLTFLPNSIKRDEEFFQKFPIWMQNGVLRRQFVRLYVSVDTEIYITSMVIGTIITALCFVSSIFLYRNINTLIPDNEDW